MNLGPPLVPYVCGNPDCLFPEGGRCGLLHKDPLVSCDKLKRRAPRQTPTPEGDIPPNSTKDFPPEEHEPLDDTRTPWTGLQLQYSGLLDVTPRALPRIVAVLGPHDAGKTSLLASFFLQLANGQYGDLGYRFASSRTLLAFDELVVRANRWKAQPGEKIVDHTDHSAGARFLHLGLRPVRSGERGAIVREPRHVDVLLSDISGEVVMSWSRRTQTADAALMAFVRHADAMLVVADAVRLTEPAGRQYDSELAGLLRRVGEILRDAPRSPSVALVFSKVDGLPESVSRVSSETVPFEESAWSRLLRAGGIRAAMRDLRTRGVTLAAFAVSAFPRPLAQGQPLGVVAPFRHALQHADRRSVMRRPVTAIDANSSSFLNYGAIVKGWE